MEAKTKKRECSSFATGEFVDSREYLYFLVTRATEKQHVDLKI